MKKIALVFTFLTLIVSQSALCNELTVLTEDLPPLNYIDNGVLVGPSVEIVKELIKRLGTKEQIKVYPWARAYKMALEEKNVVLFGMTYTEVRKDKFKWVGPLAIKRDILVGKRNSGLKIKTLGDAKKVRRIGTLLDDTRGRMLERLGFTNLEPVTDEKLNAQKLAIDRIDLWAYKIPGLRTVCDLAGIDYREFEEVYHLREIELMIAFSKKTPDAVVKKWNEAFNKMLSDGTVLKIRKKWNEILEDDPFPEINE
jgi:polar amino acid transport system substrate-binding protein